jgi:hypothetical protein
MEPVIIDYTKYVNMNAQEIQLQVFRGQGVPPNWDWDLWAKAAGKANPFTVDVRGDELEGQGGASPYTPKTDLSLVPGMEGELIVPGTLFVSGLERAGFTHWAALGGQYHGLMDVQMDGGEWQVMGAYGSMPLDIGSHTLKVRPHTGEQEPLVLRVGVLMPNDDAAETPASPTA